MSKAAWSATVRVARKAGPATLDTSTRVTDRPRQAAGKPSTSARATEPACNQRRACSGTNAAACGTPHLTRVLPASISSSIGLLLQAQRHVAGQHSDAAVDGIHQEAATIVNTDGDAFLH